MSEDRFDALERRHEENRLKAEFLAGVLGVREETTEERTTSDEQGRFIAGNADAGARSPSSPPQRPSPAEQLANILLYDDEGWPKEVIS